MVLELLLSTFGGSITPVSHKPNIVRYRLHNRAGLTTLIYAVNGEIRNPIRIQQLTTICTNYGITF